jgi:hypothetical protein
MGRRMKLIKTVLFYVVYLAFLIVASYSFGSIMANAQECGPSKLEYPIKDIKLDAKEILKKLLAPKPEPVIIKS